MSGSGALCSCLLVHLVLFQQFSFVYISNFAFLLNYFYFYFLYLKNVKFIPLLKIFTFRMDVRFFAVNFLFSHGLFGRRGKRAKPFSLFFFLSLHIFSPVWGTSSLHWLCEKRRKNVIWNPSICMDSPLISSHIEIFLIKRLPSARGSQLMGSREG